MLPRQRLAPVALLLLCLCFACSHRMPVSRRTDVGQQNGEISLPGDSIFMTALIRGDEGRIRELSDDVLSGKRVLMKSELIDARSVAPNVVLRATYAGNDWQLGVNTISEFALCLLEIKNQTSS